MAVDYNIVVEQVIGRVSWIDRQMMDGRQNQENAVLAILMDGEEDYGEIVCDLYIQNIDWELFEELNDCGHVIVVVEGNVGDGDISSMGDCELISYTLVD